MSFYRFDNEVFNFHGRWEDTENGKKSHWVRPYVEFYCDSDFVLKLDDGAGNYSVSINGEKVNEENGVYKLTDEGLIRLTADETGKTVTFQGIETDGNVKRAPSRERHILFIGDSLTHSPVSHSVIIPRTWDCDYTCVAQGGMSLCVDRGYVRVSDEHLPYKGMSAAFFCWQNPNEVGNIEPYDFSKAEHPDMIFINIGTNDHLTEKSYVDGFVDTYRGFVERIHSLYPEVPTYLLLPVADTEGGWRRNTIEKCAKEAESKYDNMTYISSRAWDVEISTDGVHPTTEGYRTFAEELMKALKN